MMTIISTLLLGVFGTNPDDKYLKSKTRDISNNLDSSGNYFPGSNILNQQKQAYFYDKFNSVERIDRDEKRQELYNKVDNFYDLSSNKEDKYDLSDNIVKYTIIDSLLNKFDENYFINSIRNSRLFNFASGNSYNYPNSYTQYGRGTYNTSYSKTTPDYEVRLDRMDGSDFESYDKNYTEEYLLDGYLKFAKAKYNIAKNDLLENNPGTTITDVSVNKEVQRRWDALTDIEQQTWDSIAEDEQDEKDEDNYDPDDFGRYRSSVIPLYRSSLIDSPNNEPCPINETPDTFKRKTGLNCYEVCPPGKERNSGGTCVRPCPSGKERKMINGDCEDI